MGGVHRRQADLAEYPVVGIDDHQVQGQSEAAAFPPAGDPMSGTFGRRVVGNGQSPGDLGVHPGGGEGRGVPGGPGAEHESGVVAEGRIRDGESIRREPPGTHSSSGAGRCSSAMRETTPLTKRPERSVE